MERTTIIKQTLADGDEQVFNDAWLHIHSVKDRLPHGTLNFGPFAIAKIIALLRDEFLDPTKSGVETDLSTCRDCARRKGKELKPNHPGCQGIKLHEAGFRIDFEMGAESTQVSLDEPGKCGLFAVAAIFGIPGHSVHLPRSR